MPARKLRLRRPGACAVCRAPVDVGVEAMWDSARKTVTCLTCDSDTTALVQSGVAGASAMAKGYQLRHDQLEDRRLLKERRPILGRMQIFMAGPPTKGESWIKGGLGEEKLGAALDAMVDQGILTLHDRQIPRSGSGATTRPSSPSLPVLSTRNLTALRGLVRHRSFPCSVTRRRAARSSTASPFRRRRRRSVPRRVASDAELPWWPIRSFCNRYRSGRRCELAG